MTRFDHTRAKTLRARHLRRNATNAELKLWFHLRSAKMNGYSFRRQHPIGPYTIDFYCPNAKLAVELDGDEHGTDKGLAHDAARTRFLDRRGVRVIRFPNHEVAASVTVVLESIHRVLQHQSPPGALRAPPSPFRGEDNSEPRTHVHHC